MRIFCLFGLHNWKYLHVPQMLPGMMRRICLHCGRTDYYEGGAA